MAVDCAGNVYIADSFNDAFKEWVAASNTVITLVSSGLADPSGVAVDGAGNVYIADTYNNAIKELPRAFVDTTPKTEPASAGSDALPSVVPATASMPGPLAPSSDSSWLTITGVTNGVVSFAFTANNFRTRTAHITVLNQSIAITQLASPTYSPLGTTNLLEGPMAGSDSVVLAANSSWTATANDSWLHLSAPNQSGTGNANVIFSFDANAGPTRTGTLTVAGQTLTVVQAGSTYVAVTNVTSLVSFGIASPNLAGVAVDGVGNVYFANSGDYTIKEWVAASNTVNTLVSSGLNSPGGVAIDAAGNVYIADYGHNAVREWVAASNTVSTLVSSGLSGPRGVAVDGAGNVFIADTYNNAIKEWVAVRNTVITLVSSGLYYPIGVAVDASGNVYIADAGNNAIKEWVAASNTVITLVSSELSQPQGVAVDCLGNLYIADAGNNAIKEWVAASNTVTTLLSSGLSSPSGVAVDGSGNVYTADSGNNAIKELPRAFVDTAPKLETAGAGSDACVVLPATANLTWKFAPVINSPWLTITGVTNGVVSFAFTANSQLNRKAYLTVLGQIITVTQPGPPNYSSLGATNRLEGPNASSDSVMLAANSSWTATANNSWLHLSVANQSGVGSVAVIFTFDANAGATRTGTLTIAGQTLTVTQAGSTYVAVTNATTLVSSGLSWPVGVAMDSVGNVYIADTFNNAVKEWLAASNNVITLASSGLSMPLRVAVDGAGNVYISDSGHRMIKEWLAASNTITTLVSSGLAQPDGVAVDGSGNVFFADETGRTIKEWLVASGTVITLVTPLSGYPSGIAVDGLGNIFFADYINAAIKEWLAVSNTVITLVSSGLSSPFGVAVDGAGNVYIADTYHSAIKEWLAASNTVVTLVSSGLSRPEDMAVDSSGNVFISDAVSNVIKELPHAFVDTTAKVETAAAGSDTLPVVLPATANMTGPFAPGSDSSWLTITGVTNGVVSFAFTANPSPTNRTANITVLGMTVAVTQSAAPVLTGIAMLNNGSFQFGFSNNSGASFTVWTATNLMLPLTNWTPLGAPSNIGSGQYQFTDPAATNDVQRFYRVTSP